MLNKTTLDFEIFGETVVEYTTDGGAFGFDGGCGNGGIGGHGDCGVFGGGGGEGGGGGGGGFGGGFGGGLGGGGAKTQKVFPVVTVREPGGHLVHIAAPPFEKLFNGHGNCVALELPAGQ